MAHKLLYNPDGVVLTCQFGNIIINVDGDFVDVKFACDNDTLIEERYYAYNGKVILYNMGELIEEYIRGKGGATYDFTLTLYNANGEVDAEHTYHTLYCDRYTVCTYPEDFLKQSFLTTLQHRRIPPDECEDLRCYMQAGETMLFSVTAQFRSTSMSEGIHAITYVTGTGSTVTAPGIKSTSIYVTAIQSKVAALYGISADSVEVVSFTVTCGQRSNTYYIDRSLSQSESFYFRNCFNQQEMLSLPLRTTAVSEVEKDIAKVNGISSFYNRVVSKTYESETGQLTADEAEWIDQFLCSHQISRPIANEIDDTEPYIVEDVLITDFSCEIADKGDKPNSVKFTWRYANNRPMTHFNASRGIFTEQFKIQYE